MFETIISSVGLGLLGVLVGIIIPLLWVKFLPNEKMYSWGYSLGKKGSEKGIALFGPDNWEKNENNITGSLVAFAQGVKDGADSEEQNSKD